MTLPLSESRKGGQGERHDRIAEAADRFYGKVKGMLQMGATPRILQAEVFLALSMLAGCGVTSTFSSATPTRPGQDLPGRFDPLPGLERITPADTLPGSGCLNPLRDPRDGTMARMFRAGEGIGDYEVPASRYGVAATELLKVDCNTGKPLGIVPR